MIRKYRFFLFMGVLCLVAIFGCSNVSETAEGSSSNFVKAEILEKVKSGHLEGVSIGIGATKKEVTEKFDTLVRGRNSEYGFTSYYDGFSLQFEDYANSIDEVKENSKVVLINADPKTVGLAGKPYEIKKILGTPSREIVDDTGDDTFILEYTVDNYLLRFTFETIDSPVQIIMLRVK
ncbi:DUF4309 domain-containing protein [Brevibacillus sp. NRS-1366]|uniref:DUF4309 domain-containing protein n=1 Tax=Brevibacillus sp. NRS-1366 TaxID=3233899 RepID=UPI003D19F0D5